MSLQGNWLIISTELSSEQSSTTTTSNFSYLEARAASKHLASVALPLWLGIITEMV
jgi:hypothetical protein